MRLEGRVALPPAETWLPLGLTLLRIKERVAIPAKARNPCRNRSRRWIAALRLPPGLQLNMVRQHMAGRAKFASVSLVALLLAASLPARAADEAPSLKVPRFVNLHSDRVNLRGGPGRQYPIEWVLTKKDMPVEVVAQFEHWRRVRDWDGTIGWVEEHMVSGRRYVMVAKGSVRPLYGGPDPGSPPIARAEPGVLTRLLECGEAMCRVEAGDVTGWMRRTDLWGIYADEKVP